MLQEQLSPIAQLRAQVSQMLDSTDAQAPIAATVVFPVNPAKEDAFVRHSEELATATRKLPGCNIYAYHQFKFQPFASGSSAAVPYMVYEDWETTGQFRTQWDSAHLKRFQDVVLDLVVGLPDLRFYYGWSDLAGSPVPKTGQRVCFDSFAQPIPNPRNTGQDGEIQAGAAWPTSRFNDNDDGTVTDKLTGLIWLRDAGWSGEVDWETALRKARGLAADGRDLRDGSKPGEWRLPTIKELFSLIDYNEANPILPAGHPFENVVPSIYWTSTTLAAAPPLAWMMTLGIGPTVFDLKINDNRAWPVRSAGTTQVPKTGQKLCYEQGRPASHPTNVGQDGETQPGAPWPRPRFHNNGDGTVTDNLTGLVWLKNADAFGLRTWEQALAVCSTLSHGKAGLNDGSGEGDWRLPNIREIESLVDYGQVGPCLPEEARDPGKPVFENVRPSSYWTSTSVARAPSEAMFIILGVGPAIFENKEHPFFVWPVRDRLAAR